LHRENFNPGQHLVKGFPGRIWRTALLISICLSVEVIVGAQTSMNPSGVISVRRRTQCKLILKSKAGQLGAIELKANRAGLGSGKVRITNRLIPKSRNE
jgi:hypothetical protein